MASSSRISPAAFGGVSSSHRDLTNLAFISSCPPVIQPNTRIIALCGVTDWRGDSSQSSSSEEEAQPSRNGPVQKFLGKGKDLLNRANPSKIKRQQRKEERLVKAYPHGNASPKHDEWFLSDFYLFHHLFRGLGAQQRWFTCENPEVLVARYHQYAHGEPSRDHRVVLDKNMLPSMKAAGNIQVSSPQDLLQEFIDYFKAECRAASERKQPVLLLVFGHDDDDTYGIVIGGAGRPIDAPRLERAYLEILMRPFEIAVTLLTSACFSGGWLIQPNLNISGLTAASSRTQSLSWKASLGRSYHGSVWALAVMESLIKMEDSKTTQYQPGVASIDIATLDPNIKSSTFARLSEVISTTLKTEVDGRDIHEISFAAQDDEWAMKWRQRSGIPLGTFQAQWDTLPRIPPQAGTGPTIVRTGGATHTERNHGFRGTLTRRQAKPLLADLCKRYLYSYPPEPRTGDDIIPFKQAEKFLETGRTDAMGLTELQENLQYRMDAMTLATTLKDLTLPAGQNFQPCHKFDFGNWCETLPQTGGKAEAFRGINNILRDASILARPTRQQGRFFSKFSDYLAAAYVESGFDRKAVDEAVETMIVYKNRQVGALTERIRYDRSVRNTARAAFTTLGKRLRSPSPQKRGGIPKFSDEIVSY